jgi:hypothetical protein
MGPPGHLAIALAAKPIAPRLPLWALLLATEVLDLLCLAFVALGIEDTGLTQTDLNQGVVTLSLPSLPWSHGLFMALVWSLLAAAITFPLCRDHRSATVIGGLVFSHWLLDFIVHPAELPLLFEGSPMLGLGLWTSGPGLVTAAVLEFALLAAGTLIYLRTRKRTTTHITGRQTV